MEVLTTQHFITNHFIQFVSTSLLLLFDSLEELVVLVSEARANGCLQFGQLVVQMPVDTLSKPHELLDLLVLSQLLVLPVHYELGSLLKGREPMWVLKDLRTNSKLEVLHSNLNLLLDSKDVITRSMVLVGLRNTLAELPVEGGPGRLGESALVLEDIRNSTGSYKAFPISNLALGTHLPVSERHGASKLQTVRVLVVAQVNDPLLTS